MAIALRQLSPDEYPQGLREIPKPPEKLWMLGEWAPKGTKYLTVVGSRAATPYGKEMCTKLIQGLKDYPVSIVSGLALGIDAIAHKAALDAGMHTIAVPGSGLSSNAIYPRSNAELAKDILTKGGALLSEHEPDHKAEIRDFPSRNRIMVGISDAVLMIEAGEKSGTLITARLAGEYNRDLLCVPHRAGDPHGFGSHLFIRLGAALITEPKHILEALGIPEERNGPLMLPLLDGIEKDIYGMLHAPLTKADLLRRLEGNEDQAESALVTLELKGLIKEGMGMWQRV
ncbi:DNA-processing protein DprA [Patescibacteria group bacterium]|nr:DNA-processing protein DprA [Patescibacteria group bacterium]